MIDSLLLICGNSEFSNDLRRALHNDIERIDLATDHETLTNSSYDIVLIYSERAPVFLYEIRSHSNIPIIVLDDDRISACDYLDAGADDFMVVPVSFKELLARIRTVVRRSRHFNTSGDSEIRFDNIVISKDRYDIRIGGKAISFSSREFSIMYLLASNPNRVFSRDEILTLAFGKEYEGDLRTVDVHIKKIRDKLGKPSSKWDIKTVRGVGYKFSAI